MIEVGLRTIVFAGSKEVLRGVQEGFLRWPTTKCTQGVPTLAIAAGELYGGFFLKMV
jgi:hypothetical protein